jgi:hypothetical protein
MLMGAVTMPPVRTYARKRPARLGGSNGSTTQNAASDRSDRRRPSCASPRFGDIWDPM